MIGNCDSHSGALHNSHMGYHYRYTLPHGLPLLHGLPLSHAITWDTAMEIQDAMLMETVMFIMSLYNING